MNSDIGSIQSIVDAINARDYIVKVEELADKSGYAITFAQGKTITVKHGKDGKDAPVIGIDIYEGVYYWTLTTNGDKIWLLDSDGNRLKVSGVDGKSAYDLAVEKGYTGTLEEWLESLKGSNGQDGSNGKSAYELAVEKGYTGTLEEWLEALNGTNGSDGSNGSDGENGKDGITPILGVDSEGYWTIDMGNGAQRLKDANGNDVKAIGRNGEDGADGGSFFSNVRYDENFVYFTFSSDGKTISIPLSKGVSFTVTGASAEQSFIYGESRTFDIIQSSIAKISISKPDGWKVSVSNNLLTVTAPSPRNTFAERGGEIAITAMGTDQKSFTLFSFNVEIDRSIIAFADVGFYEYLVAHFVDQDGNGSISQTEANEVTEIDCRGLGITSIAGIKNFPNLVSLICSNNSLTSLDVSGCTSLTSLSCEKNRLTALDVSNNTALTYLDCSNNQLTALDVSKNTALTDLCCEDNQLTALNVSNNTALESLSCVGNQLTALDISNNTALLYLLCHDNPGDGTVFPVTAWFDNNTGSRPPYFATGSWEYNETTITIDYRKVK